MNRFLLKEDTSPVLRPPPPVPSVRENTELIFYRVPPWLQCAAACEDIRQRVPGAALDALTLDLSSVESIRGFVETFHKTGLPLHVLVNNAGEIRHASD